ncbi:MAG: hypothetical protein MUC95_08560 [Spirochaetes bacterium]|nr:hypothetical protein [Spirochaetota bacterium]
MKKLYSFNDEPRCAYLLKSGTVFFEIRDKELYKIAGKNLIVAASEILLNFNPDSLYYRGYNFYRDDAAEIAEISPGNLRTLVYKYTAGYNINVFFAQKLRDIMGMDILKDERNDTTLLFRGEAADDLECCAKFFFQSVTGEQGQSVFVSMNILDPDALDEINRRSQPDDAGDVRGAGFEACRGFFVECFWSAGVEDHATAKRDRLERLEQ